MKYVACHSNYGVLNENGNMFNGVGNVSVKDFLKQMSGLKKQGLNNDISFLTSDEISVHDAHAFMFIDTPEANNAYFRKAISTGKPIFLLAWESGIINEKNTDSRFHTDFNVIFTYDDTLIDHDRYIKVAYSFEFPKNIIKRYHGKKLCCLIAGNKASSHPQELYSHRLDIIDWFERKHSGDFDLYGQGWSKIIPPRNFIHRVVNRFSSINQYIKPRHKSYRGEVNNKLSTYEKYLFSICYENARNVPGYISEKIFDCFFAGCVPIYWGAPNISDHIPEHCYIDRRKFEDNEALYNHISQMKEDEYLNHLQAIEEFLQTNRMGIFSIDEFSKKIINNILKHI